MIKHLINILDIIFIGLMWIVGGLLFLVRVAIILVLAVTILTLITILKFICWGIGK